MTLKETASQTAGPYVHIGLAPGAAGFEIYQNELGQTIAAPQTSGERIRVEGLVIDGDGQPVKDVLLEVWQANADGHYAHPDGGPVEDGFRGFGRVITDFDTGAWAFDTVKPGRVPGRDGDSRQAPHINFWLVARGINIGLHTRMYFDDEPEANSADLVLGHLNDRRSTLLATRTADGLYRFEIRLQGDRETVFFDI